MKQRSQIHPFFLMFGVIAFSLGLNTMNVFGNVDSAAKERAVLPETRENSYIEDAIYLEQGAQIDLSRCVLSSAIIIYHYDTKQCVLVTDLREDTIYEIDQPGNYTVFDALTGQSLIDEVMVQDPPCTDNPFLLLRGKSSAQGSAFINGV